MNKLKFLLPLVAICILLGGCPYESKVPIDNATVKVNSALLGKWKPKSGSEDRYTVSKVDEYTYKIEKKKKDVKEPDIYKAFLSHIDEDVFLNLYEAKENIEQRYFFYKVSLNKSETKVTLSPVTENIDEVFEKPEDLKAFFQKNKGLSFFFEKEEEVFIKED